ncbi:MAG: histidinol-phosphate transaminase [Gammaproteobacteria bacterium]
MIASERVTSIFRRAILSMKAYHVADAAGLIKLDAMENPYHWPEPVIQNWLDRLKDSELNRYPDPEARALKFALRRVYGISEAAEILLGNGSDEIILLLQMALTPGAKILAPEPSFVMYRQISQSLDLEFVGVPLRPDDFGLDLPAMLDAIRVHRPAIVFLAYPNNPTGNLFDENAVLEIIETTDGLVVIDEAYAPFAEASFMNRLGFRDNLLIMRTLSKLGLAGLRLGYLAGSPEVIEQLNKIRLPYNINILTQITAEFALDNGDMFDLQTTAIRNERVRVCQALQQMEGITVFPSSANFVLFRTQNNKATDIFEALKTQGILIKNLSSQGGLLHDCLRATIGTPEENTAFLNALDKCLR